MFGIRCELVISYSFLFLLLFQGFFSLAEECVVRQPCACEYSDGKIIDLKPLSEGNFINSTFQNLIYHFHPCTNKNLTFPSTNKTQSCSSGTSLCVYDKDNDTITNLGKIENSKLGPSTSEPGNVELIYNLEKDRITHVILSCTHLKETILVVQNKKTLMLFSPYACATLVYQGLSTGSILVILFFVFSAIYLCGGCCVLHFLRGARGKEMIPNVDFWMGLPLLVRDGVIFLQNGCKPPQIPGETYDRI